MMCHMTTSLTAAAAGFFAALAASNTREHWGVHRARYDTDLRPRFVALLDAVPAERLDRLVLRGNLIGSDVRHRLRSRFGPRLTI